MICTAETPLESNEDDFREGVDPDETEVLAPQKYTGYCYINGNWILHLFESEDPLMKRYVNALHGKLSEAKSMYQQIWVVHYTEDIV